MKETEEKGPDLVEGPRFIISNADREEFKRLDQFLAAKIEGLSRTFLKRLFEKGMVTGSADNNAEVNLTLSKMPPIGTRVEVEVPPPLPPNAVAQNIPLEILYEDEHLLFVNKPVGMVTHPAPGHADGTLVNAVLYHCKDLPGIGERIRPGIVHRLDKGTSGVMVVAKTQACHEALVLMFSEHNIERRYEALVLRGDLPAGGKIVANIGRHPKSRLKMAAHVSHGRHAVTHYKVLANMGKLAHVELKLETGRTHQIRVHLSQVLHGPVLCDPLYGNPPEHLRRLGPEFEKHLADWPHPFLHAKALGLQHPITGQPLRFEVPRPEMFQKALLLAQEILGEP